MIQLCAHVVVHFIRHIFNCILESSTFPDCWKKSLILPFPKNKNPKQMSDLRPISVLPVLSKVFEKLVAEQLRTHLIHCDILPKTQSGYRPGYGCSVALLDLIDDICRALDDGELTALVLLDYSKAFDTINHSLLLSILHFIGLGDSSVALFSSYLFNRQQSVVVSGSHSQPLLVRSGVPQGSILGPILFTIYTSNLYDCLNCCKYHVYADDTQLYRSFKLSEVESNINYINDDLKSLSEVSRKFNLAINSSKSNVLLFGNRQTRIEAEPLVNIYVEGSKLSLTDSAKCLGVLLEPDLRFKRHIRCLIQKSFSTLKFLYSNRHILNKKLKILLCESLILSRFNYCDVVYHRFLDASDRERIQKVQKACLRFIHSIRMRDRVSHLLGGTGWLSMADRRGLHSACLYHKIMSTQRPSYLHDRVRYRTDVHNLNVRRKDLLDVPKHRTEAYKRSFSYSIVQCYNNIPDLIKLYSFQGFKRKVKQMIISKVITF